MGNNNWLKDNGMGIAIITLLVGNFYWTDAKFEKNNDRISFHLANIEKKLEKVDERSTKMDERFHFQEREIDLINDRFSDRFSILENELSIMKTVMLMKNIMPPELAVKDEK